MPPLARRSSAAPPEIVCSLRALSSAASTAGSLRATLNLTRPRLHVLYVTSCSRPSLATPRGPAAPSSCACCHTSRGHGRAPATRSHLASFSSKFQSCAAWRARVSGYYMNDIYSCTSSTSARARRAEESRAILHTAGGCRQPGARRRERELTVRGATDCALYNE